jgi:hypothetical protein
MMRLHKCRLTLEALEDRTLLSSGLSFADPAVSFWGREPARVRSRLATFAGLVFRIWQWPTPEDWVTA